MAMSVVYGTAFGGVISENRGGVVSVYVPDTLGNTIGLINSAGTLTDRWTYWPFGETNARTGTNATPLTFLGIIGYFQDVASKLLYVRARHLRVDLARWLTVDPKWPNQRAYVYAGDRPAKYADPSGLWPWDACGIVDWGLASCSGEMDAQCTQACGRTCSPVLSCWKFAGSCDFNCVCGPPTANCIGSLGVGSSGHDCLGMCMEDLAQDCFGGTWQQMISCLAFATTVCVAICFALLSATANVGSRS